MAKNKWANADKFMTETLGKKYDIDGVAGVQCVDYFKLFTRDECGKVIVSGNGMATGYWLNAKTKVIALGFKAVTKASDLKKGDWLITKTTDTQPYGHIGMVKSVTKKGVSVQLQGQNQGGKGGAVNVISYSLKNFLGAYRYTKWPTASTAAPSTATPTKTATASGIEVGSKVKLKAYADYTGTPLIKTRPYYFVSAIAGDKVLLRADNAKSGVVYANVKKTNLKEVK